MRDKRIEPSLDVNRREFIAAASSVNALGIVSVAASALAENEDECKLHRPHEYKHQDMVEAAQACLSSGRICISRCLDLMAAGDSRVAECAKNVNLMIPFCDMFTRFAIADSALLKDITRLCIEVSENCENACRDHEDEFVECYECAEACGKLIRACGSFAG